jgi:hypothetical protein
LYSGSISVRTRCADHSGPLPTVKVIVLVVEEPWRLVMGRPVRSFRRCAVRGNSVRSFLSEWK